MTVTNIHMQFLLVKDVAVKVGVQCASGCVLENDLNTLACIVVGFVLEVG